MLELDFVLPSNNFPTQIHSTHISTLIVFKKAKKRESNKRRCFEMERNPLKGGQACGGDGHLKGSK